MNSVFNGGSGVSLLQTVSHSGKHVSFCHSTSSDAASESIPLSRSTRSTPPPPPPQRKSTNKPGGVHSHHHHFAATATAGGGSRNTGFQHTASASDPRQWIIALGQQNVSSDDTNSPAADKNKEASGSKEKERSKERNDCHYEGREAQAGSNRFGSSSSPPLEERIGLHELQVIMLAFRFPSYATDPRIMSSTMPPAPPTRPPSAGNKTKAVSVQQKVPYFVSCDAQSVLDDTVRYVDDLSFTVADLLAKERDTPHLLATEHSQMRAAGQYNDKVSDDAVAMPSPPASGATPAAMPLHSLSREDFTHVLQRAVPSATPAEIQSLLAKAIPDNQETVSWNELATFLVTCSRQKEDLVMEDQRFVLAGQPSSLHFEEQHGESITCVAVSRQRRLIVTGCSGGSVRAWSSGGDLAYRGMLLKVDGWIMGLHWGCGGRVLYVVTMDRYVYVLDGTTYEVLRVFHGRGIKGTPASVAYATETISKVNVGGVALPKHRPPNERGYAGARLRLSSSRKKAPSSAREMQRRSSPGRGRNESGEDRMHRLLSSAMQMRRGVQLSNRVEQTGTGGTTVVAAAANAAAVPDASSAADHVTEGISGDVAGANGSPNTTMLTTDYTLTTASAAEALHQDTTPLTGAGRGPYVVQHVDEGVLTSLVDALTATAYGESAFQEDVLLLGTSKGDAFLFILATQSDLTQRHVLVARHVFTQLHRGHITKLEFSRAFNALISSGEDGRVRVTSLMTGQVLRTFYAPELPEQHASVTDFALHPQLKMLLTIGPERRALVWEWNQPTPIAVLESVNRPLCCGVFLGEQLLTVSRDRVLHVYDIKSFCLRQELALRSAGSLTLPSSVSCGAPTLAASTSSFSPNSASSSCMITHLYADPVRQRVLGFGRFPFALCVKRQVSSGCPARYRGHHAPLFTTLTSRAFGQLVTVGTDGVVMTWTPGTGVSEFSFLLSNFSNAAATTGSPMPPVAATMDVLQRRLLTGFAGGVMVAWNILNGQVERVLTAAASSLSIVGNGLGAGAAAAAALSGSPPAAGEVTSKVRGRGTSQIAGANERAATATMPTPSAAAASATPRRDVTAVGSFLRYRSLSYLFAVGRTLYVDIATANTTAASAAARGGGVDGCVSSSSSPSPSSASPQLGEYTTTYPSAWTPQLLYGEITQLLQFSPQHVACGTSSGAVLVYNVLSDCQEGAPLWVSESMLYPAAAATHGTFSLSTTTTTTTSAGTLRGGASMPTASACARSTASRREGGGGGAYGSEEGTLRAATLPRRSGSNGAVNAEQSKTLLTVSNNAAAALSGDNAPAAVGQRGYVAARIIRLLNLATIHPRLLIAAQEDGTLSCWHTLLRVCIGAVNLTAVGLAEEEADSNGNSNNNNNGTGSVRQRDDGLLGTFVFDMDAGGELLVFGDGDGNVHICRTAWQVLSTSAEQVVAMALPNPLLYTPPPQPAATHSLFSGVTSPQNEEADREYEKTPSAPTTAAAPDFNEVQRSVPLLRRLERVHVFASGLVLTGLCLVDAAATTVFSPAGPMTTTAAATESGGQLSMQPTADTSPNANAATAAPSRQLLIVCTGADHYVRVFTLAGLPIGELGMDEWDVANPRTFRYMGESMGVPAAPLPCSVPGNPYWQRDTKEALEASPCYFNYLADLHTTHFPRSGLISSGSRGSARHSRISLGRPELTRWSVSAGTRAAQALQLDTLNTPALERALSPSTTTANHRSASPTDRRTLRASPKRGQAASLNPTESTGTVSPAAPAAAEEEEWKVGEKDGGEEDVWLHRAPATPPHTRSLSTRLHRSTRYRYSASPSSQIGVVKASCVDAVLRAAAAAAASPSASSPRGQPLSREATEPLLFNTAASVQQEQQSASPFKEKEIDWAEKEWSATSSLPSGVALRHDDMNAKAVVALSAQDEVVTGYQQLLDPLRMATVSEGEHPLHDITTGRGENVVGRNAAAVPGVLQRACPERYGSASLCRCNSASTRLPMSPASPPRKPRESADTFSVSLTVCGKPPNDSPLPTGVPPLAEPQKNRAALKPTCDSSPRPPTSDFVRRLPNADSTTPTNTTPSSPEPRGQQLQQCAVLPSLFHHTPNGLDSSPSPSNLNVTREKRSTIATPLSQRSMFLRTPSVAALPCDTPAESVGRYSFTSNTNMNVNNNINSTLSGSISSEATVFGMLSRARQRLLKCTRTPAARDQLSSVAVPTPYSLAQASAAAATTSATAATSSPSARSPTKGTSRVCTTALAGNVQQHIDALLEQRRAQHVFGVSPAAEMRKSAEGFVAHMTSQLYVAPLQQPTSPALTTKRRELPSTTLPSSRSHSHSEFNQTL